VNADEKAIIEYLKSWPYSFVSGKEIARRASGKARHDKEPGWAVPLLAQMVQRGAIESDHLGYFKLKPEDRRKKKREQKQVSPQLLKILKSSGKSFDGLAIDEDAEPPA
jgi:hypothetical protein